MQQVIYLKTLLFFPFCLNMRGIRVWVTNSQKPWDSSTHILLNANINIYRDVWGVYINESLYNLLNHSGNHVYLADRRIVENFTGWSKLTSPAVNINTEETERNLNVLQYKMHVTCFINLFLCIVMPWKNETTFCNVTTT